MCSSDLEYGPLDAPHTLGSDDLWLEGAAVGVLPDVDADGRDELWVSGAGPETVAAVYRGWGR